MDLLFFLFLFSRSCEAAKQCYSTSASLAHLCRFLPDWTALLPLFANQRERLEGCFAHRLRSERRSTCSSPSHFSLSVAESTQLTARASPAPHTMPPKRPLPPSFSPPPQRTPGPPPPAATSAPDSSTEQQLVKRSGINVGAVEEAQGWIDELQGRLEEADEGEDVVLTKGEAGDLLSVLQNSVAGCTSLSSCRPLRRADLFLLIPVHPSFSRSS